MALAATANDVSAQTVALQVQIYDYAGLSPATLQEVIKRVHEILTGSGVSVEVDACAEGAKVLCKGQIGNSRRIFIRLVDGTAKDLKYVQSEALGVSIAGHDGGTYATVFLQPTKDAAREADLGWVIVLAYAATHEIGHLVLGDQAHTHRGLMKADWDPDDFVSMAQNRLHFTAEQTRELTSRYGAAPQLEPGAVAIRH